MVVWSTTSTTCHSLHCLFLPCNSVLHTLQFTLWYLQVLKSKYASLTNAFKLTPQRSLICILLSNTILFAQSLILKDISIAFKQLTIPFHPSEIVWSCVCVCVYTCVFSIETLGLPSVLVFYESYNKVPKTGWLKITEIFLSSRSQKVLAGPGSL